MGGLNKRNKRVLAPEGKKCWTVLVLFICLRWQTWHGYWLFQPPRRSGAPGRRPGEQAPCLFGRARLSDQEGRPAVNQHLAGEEAGGRTHRFLPLQKVLSLWKRRGRERRGGNWVRWPNKAARDVSVCVAPQVRRCNCAAAAAAAERVRVHERVPLLAVASQRRLSCMRRPPRRRSQPNKGCQRGAFLSFILTWPVWQLRAETVEPAEALGLSQR